MFIKSFYNGFVKPVFLISDRREYQNIFLSEKIFKILLDPAGWVKSLFVPTTQIAQERDNQRIEIERDFFNFFGNKKIGKTLDREYLGANLERGERRSNVVGIDFMTNQRKYIFSRFNSKSEEYKFTQEELLDCKKNFRDFVSSL